jgi:hypothetical protein
MEEDGLMIQVMRNKCFGAHFIAGIWLVFTVDLSYIAAG